MSLATEFRYSAIVPVYRHEAASRHVVEELARHGLHVFLVDDGNTLEGHQILKQIANDIPHTTLITHKVNGGKGKAVCSGLKYAYKAGFTHALQVDADGQHDLGAVPFFIEKSREHPKDLICAYPKYDASVPKAREQGRKITNFWVTLETLSTRIPDSMCGFRMYPLKSVWPVAKKIRNYRMGFDIEILVKLSWKNVYMRFFPLKVNYPEDGISNFRMFHDNVAISLTHAKLFCGMLFRLPLILSRKIF